MYVCKPSDHVTLTLFRLCFDREEEVVTLYAHMKTKNSDPVSVTV